LDLKLRWMELMMERLLAKIDANQEEMMAKMKTDRFSSLPDECQ
jgi:hypothetical protein